MTRNASSINRRKFYKLHLIIKLNGHIKPNDSIMYNGAFELMDSNEIIGYSQSGKLLALEHMTISICMYGTHWMGSVGILKAWRSKLFNKLWAHIQLLRYSNELQIQYPLPNEKPKDMLRMTVSKFLAR